MALKGLAAQQAGHPNRFPIAASSGSGLHRAVLGMSSLRRFSNIIIEDAHSGMALIREISLSDVLSDQAK